MERLVTRSLVILSILVLVFAITACGGGGEESEPEPDEAASQEPDEDEPQEEETDDSDEEDETDEEFGLDGWRNPSDVKSITENFSRLVWRWAGLDEDGNENDPTRMAYQFDGEEEIDGANTEKISVTMNENEVVFWVDEDGKVARMQMDGEMVPSEMTESLANPILITMLWPFKTAENLQVHDVLNREGPGWDWKIVSTDTRTISGMQAKVTRIRLDLGPPHVPEGSDNAPIEWEIGDFGDFQMLLSWNSETASGDGMWEFAMTVEEIEPR